MKQVAPVSPPAEPISPARVDEDGGEGLSMPGDKIREIWLRGTRRLAFAFHLAAAAGLCALVAALFWNRAPALPLTEVAGLPVEVLTTRPVESFKIMERYTGRIEPRRRTRVAFDRGGRVESVLVDEGAFVDAGDIVARLDDRELLAERLGVVAERDRIDAQIRLAQLTLDRTEGLANRGGASEQALDDAVIRLEQLNASRRAVEARLAALDLAIENTTLTAPFAARVGARDVDEGAVVGAGTAMLTLIETVQPRLKVGLPETRLRELAPGQEVRVVYRGVDLSARLLASRPDLDPLTQTVPVLFELDAAAEDLRFGDTADLVLPRDQPGPGYVLPVAALTPDPRGLWTVYTVTETGRVGMESVEIIAAADGRAFVRGSLRPGAAVVASGVHRLVPGQEVEPLNASGPER
jgi:RND family efflux transporter MFP subunit